MTLAPISHTISVKPVNVNSTVSLFLIGIIPFFTASPLRANREAATKTKISQRDREIGPRCNALTPFTRQIAWYQFRHRLRSYIPNPVVGKVAHYPNPKKSGWGT